MNILKNIIEVLDEIKDTEKQIKPLQERLNDKRNTLSELNEKLPFMLSLRDFLSKKILEKYSEEELEQVNDYRKDLKYKKLHPETTFYSSNKIFDPFNDSWYIYDYEREGDKIRMVISCKKNEGSISGLLTFLDTHYTNWFEISELEMFNDGI